MIPGLHIYVSFPGGTASTLVQCVDLVGMRGFTPELGVFFVLWDSINFQL